jgi:hypothetical protein
LSLWRVVGLGLLAVVSGCMPPSWGANALLHPGRRVANGSPPQKFESLELAGDGVVLKAWYEDRETPVDHSRRVFEALRGPNNRLLVVPEAGHGNVLNAATWKEIDQWIDTIVPAAPSAG